MILVFATSLLIPWWQVTHQVKIIDIPHDIFNSAWNQNHAPKIEESIDHIFRDDKCILKVCRVLILNSFVWLCWHWKYIWELFFFDYSSREACPIRSFLKPAGLNEDKLRRSFNSNVFSFNPNKIASPDNINVKFDKDEMRSISSMFVMLIAHSLICIDSWLCLFVCSLYLGTPSKKTRHIQWHCH